MGRKLSYKTLILMEGQKVVVHDLEYDAYDQLCEIKIIKERLLNRITKKYQEYITKIVLFNEEFIFEYDAFGKCINGEFEVYAK